MSKSIKTFIPHSYAGVRKLNPDCSEVHQFDEARRLVTKVKYDFSKTEEEKIILKERKRALKGYKFQRQGSRKSA